MPRMRIADDVELEVRITGDGPPLLLVMGTSGSLGLWSPVIDELARTHRVIAYDHRGMGGSTPSTEPVTMRSLADDAAALLDALEVDRAHVVGWSLGSAVGQELALGHPDKVASLVLYATWGRADGFQSAVLTGLRHPWATGDVEAALGALGIAFSPEALNDPGFPDLFAQFLPLFPQTPEQVRMTALQWDADQAHDTLDRLPQITAPTTVLVGEQDLLTPPWQARAVAEAIPGAAFVLFEGPGSSHALHVERTAEWLEAVQAHLARHSPAAAAA